jgi:hypothetical protein
MIDREPLKRPANGGRKPDKPVRHNLGALAAATFRPSPPCFARRNGAWSAFRSRHMGNVG